MDNRELAYSIVSCLQVDIFLRNVLAFIGLIHFQLFLIVHLKHTSSTVEYVIIQDMFTEHLIFLISLLFELTDGGRMYGLTQVIKLANGAVKNRKEFHENIK